MNLDALTRIINSFNKLSGRAVFYFALVCAISLTTILSYGVMGDAIDLVSTFTQELRDTKQKVINLSNKIDAGLNISQSLSSGEELELFMKVHNQLLESKDKTGADWILLWGFHNGIQSGPVHYKRLSIIDEVANKEKRIFSSELQNLPVNLFIKNLYPVFQGKTVIGFTEDKDANTKAQLLSNGIYFEIVVPWYIIGLEYPLGLISYAAGEEKAAELKQNPDQIPQIKKQLEALATFISVQYSTYYSSGAN